MSEERPQRTFDKLTNIDEYTKEARDELKKLNESFSSMTSALNQIAVALGVSPGDLPHQIADRYDATFPSSGEYAFPAGRTAIDLRTGIVKFPDSPNLQYMSHSLQDVIGRSIEIKTEKEVSLVLYDGDRVELSSAVFPKLYRKTYVEFTAIEITTTVATNMWLTVSSEPEGVPELKLADYEEGNPYVVRGTLAAAGDQVDIDIRTNLGRNSHAGFIANVGPLVGELQVYENDGSGWTDDYYTIVLDGVENLEYADISQIRLVANLAGANYEINMR